MAMATVTGPPPILGLLGDPLRWQLVAELGRSDRRVSELVQLVGKPQNLVSYHLAELRRGGLVSARRSSADGRDVYYRADLEQCRELLGGAGHALHPGLRLVAAANAAADDGRQRGRPPRVLFLCTGNSARSQIAQALLEHRSAGAVEARSAGSHPKPLHPEAVRVMAERGIDIAARQPKPLTRFLRLRFDRVVTLCDKVREICPQFAGPPVSSHWSIADPTTGPHPDRSPYTAMRRVADDIDARVGLLIAELDLGPAERTSHA